MFTCIRCQFSELVFNCGKWKLDPDCLNSKKNSAAEQIITNGIKLTIRVRLNPTCTHMLSSHSTIHNSGVVNVTGH